MLMKFLQLHQISLGIVRIIAFVADDHINDQNDCQQDTDAKTENTKNTVSLLLKRSECV